MLQNVKISIALIILDEQVAQSVNQSSIDHLGLVIGLWVESHGKF